MGLNASVFCNCYEKASVRMPPPQPDLVYVDEHGQVCLKWNTPGADQFGFYAWLMDACEHGPHGELVSRRLGNAVLISRLRSIISKAGERCPILLTKVVCEGAH